MPQQTELEKINLAAEYIGRYFEKEEAVKTCFENKDYLKTYIHDNSYVVKNFDLKSKIFKAMMICLGAAAAVFLVFLLLLGTDLLIVPIIAFATVFVLGTAFVIALNKFRLTEAEKHQVEINEGINEQLVMLDDRIKQAERQRDDYYAALEKRIDFMSLDYMKNIDQIKGYIENGQAETCEDAVALFEQQLLMQQMTCIIENSEEKPASAEENLERFGDPLKVIKENKKKKRKEKKAKK